MMKTTIRLASLSLVLAGVIAPDTASAQRTETFTLDAPLEKTVYNPCTEEDVRFEGVVRVEVTTERTGEREFRMHGRIDARHLTGTGLESGMQYRGRGEVEFDEIATGLPARADAQARFQIMSEGEAPDTYGRLTLRIVLTERPNERSDIQVRNLDLHDLECRD